MRRFMVAAVAVLAWWLPAWSFGDPPSPSPLDPEWRLVAESDLIVRSRLELPKAQLEHDIKTKEGNHEILTLHVSEVVKRFRSIKSTQCAYWTGPQDDMPSPKEVLSLDGREVLAFTHRGFGPLDTLLGYDLAAAPKSSYRTCERIMSRPRVLAPLWQARRREDP